MVGERELDCRGLLCVAVLMRLQRLLRQVPVGTVVRVLVDDPAAPLDLPAWCHLTGHDYRGRVWEEPATFLVVKSGAARPVHAHAPRRTAD